jgi:methylmalonyl-CoA mutase
MAIQLIINREWAWPRTKPTQGAFIIEELTELLEAVLLEFERIAERWRCSGRDGNRLPARRVQDESMQKCSNTPADCPSSA